MLDRRRFIATSGLALGGVALAQSARAAPDLLSDIQERTFRFFWDTTNPATGLAPDRWPTKAFASIAAVGFALTAYPIGVQRGWITRAQARGRTLATLRFFAAAPQGPQPTGGAGHKGFFYHFLDMKTGLRAGDSELSTVDTALFLAGALYCQSYFGRDAADEAEIRKLAEAIYRRVDWQWAQVPAPAISHGWSPECGFLMYDWRGYNEAMIVYRLSDADVTEPAHREQFPYQFEAYCVVRFGTELSLELSVTNTGERPFDFEEALHAYLVVGDVRKIRVEGLDGASYRDKVLDREDCVQEGDLRFDGETDRVYRSTGDVTVVDPVLGRVLRIRKKNSGTTVVWNPGAETAAAIRSGGMLKGGASEEYLTGRMARVSS